MLTERPAGYFKGLGTYVTVMDNGTAFDLKDALNEGAIIAGILFFWGVLAALGLFFWDASPRGSPIGSLGRGAAGLLLMVGTANVILYIVFRSIEKFRSH